MTTIDRRVYYPITPGAQKLFDEWWPESMKNGLTRDREQNFRHRMVLLGIELLLYHYQNMDRDTQKRASWTLSQLKKDAEKANKFTWK